MTLNKKIVVTSKHSEEKSARNRLVGFLKDRWINKQVKMEEKFKEKGMDLKVGILLDDEEL